MLACATMRAAIRPSRRPTSAVLAALLLLQAVLTAWHGAAIAGSRLGGVAGMGSIVICTAHGSVRVAAEGELLPVDPAQDPSGQSIKCPLCLALSADVWAPPVAATPVFLSFRGAVVVPPSEHVVAHAPRAPPHQRGPPSHA